MIISEVPSDLLEAARLVFPQYLFKRGSGNKAEYCCSACREWHKLDLRYLVKEYYHNQTVECQRCKHAVTVKHIGRMSTYRSISEKEQIAFIIPVSHDEIYIRCFIGYTKYSDEDLSPEPSYYEIQTARLAPGEYEVTSYNSWGATTKHKNPVLPFRNEQNNFGYYIFGIENLAETFLKYIHINPRVFLERSVPFLCWAAKYPEIEIFQKIGFDEPINDLTFGNRPNKRLINWSARKPWELLRLTKPEFTEFMRAPSVRALEHKRKDKVDIKTAMYMATKDYTSWEKTFETADNIKVDRFTLIKYMQRRPNEGLYHWYDYIDMALTLNFDMARDRVLFPKDLAAAHDNAMVLYNAHKNEIKNENFQKLLQKRIEKYSYSNEDYAVVVPPTISSIIHEGKRLRHCVASYAERHANGKLHILFIRRVTTPNTPLYTVEITNKGALIQAHGYKNRSLDEDASAFLDMFIKQLKGKKK